MACLKQMENLLEKMRDIVALWTVNPVEYDEIMCVRAVFNTETDDAKYIMKKAQRRFADASTTYSKSCRDLKTCRDEGNASFCEFFEGINQEHLEELNLAREEKEACEKAISKIMEMWDIVDSFSA